MSPTQTTALEKGVYADTKLPTDAAYRAANRDPLALSNGLHRFPRADAQKKLPLAAGTWLTH